MTVRELKNYLQDALDNLEENYEDDQEVRVVSNTYFLRGATAILETRKGFVDLDNPVDEEDEDWDDEEDEYMEEKLHEDEKTITTIKLTPDKEDTEDYSADNNSKYIVHSDVDENNVYAEFDTFKEALEYAREHISDETWVDYVEYEGEELSDDSVIEHYTVWSYLDDQDSNALLDEVYNNENTLKEDTEKERLIDRLINSNPKIKAVADLYDMGYHTGEIVEAVLKDFDLVEDDEFIFSVDTLKNKELCDKIYAAVREKVIEMLEDPFEDFGDSTPYSDLRPHIMDLFNIEVYYK